jgi:hypothetical protein
VSRTRSGWFVVPLMLCLALVSCSKEGPTGPAGPTGPQGSGSRVVYTGTITGAARTDGQVISAPALHLSDFPLVAVYVSDSQGGWVMCNLVLYDSVSDTNVIFETAVLHEGQVVLFSKSGVSYKVVIVS